MKRFLVLLIIYIITSPLFAQSSVINAPNAISYQNPVGVDYIFIFANTINAEINYIGNASAADTRWYTYDGTMIASGIKQFSPEDATGYILKAGTGTATDSLTFWVIDYSKHLPILSNFYVDENQNNPCDELLLKWEGESPLFEYKTPLSPMKKYIYREFTIEWKSLKWANDKWEEEIQTKIQQGYATNITIPAPYTNTTFKLSGDQYATQLGLTPVSIETPEYTAIAICDTVITITETRDGEKSNEQERPTTATTLSGSAPLDIQFSAKANEPIAQYYQWKIYKDNILLVQRSDREHRYTFDEYGVYKVKLTVSNQANCSDSTEITINVSESMLQIPNVFTPNGDGKNDEFRVAYKSIVEFHAWVFNSWGRKVFEWTDPAKGWDGKINGKNASPGAYYYIIQAKGADGVKYKEKGDINLIGR